MRQDKETWPQPLPFNSLSVETTAAAPAQLRTPRWTSAHSQHPCTPLKWRGVVPDTLHWPPAPGVRCSADSAVRPASPSQQWAPSSGLGSRRDVQSMGIKERGGEGLQARPDVARHCLAPCRSWVKAHLPVCRTLQFTLWSPGSFSLCPLLQKGRTGEPQMNTCPTHPHSFSLTIRSVEETRGSQSTSRHLERGFGVS